MTARENPVAYARKWRNKNRAAIRAYGRAYYRKNRKLIQSRQRFYSTGVTEDEFDAAWKKQKGRCKLCGQKFKRREPRDADHNHKTGRFRGILHRRCNMGLGAFEDSLRIVRRAVKYLEKHDNKLNRRTEA